MTDETYRSLALALYEALPAGIREQYSFEQWSWLSDADKAAMEIKATEPEWDE